ncbi:MAG: hypothetical protein CFE26_01615 [Verrucomicrobiales bacterium VVV1]|nr:MAG: hypothetical protein CFE26_01615 [Verrucomicrobiales bacterium VVV1]
MAFPKSSSAFAKSISAFFLPAVASARIVVASDWPGKLFRIAIDSLIAASQSRASSFTLAAASANRIVSADLERSIRPRISIAPGSPGNFESTCSTAFCASSRRFDSRAASASPLQ